MAKNKRKKSKKVEELQRQIRTANEYIEYLHIKCANLLENNQTEPHFFFIAGTLVGFLLGVIIGEVL